MADMEWIKVAEDQEIKERVPFVVKLEKREVMLYRIDGTVHACGHKCTHYGAPLSEGIISEHHVTCPWHMAKFDLISGKNLAPPALDDLPAYPVKVEGGSVYIGKPEKSQFPAIQRKDTPVFVIVGAGAAGNAAAETLRSEGFDGRVLLLTAEEDRPYDRPNLSKDFLAGGYDPAWMPLRSEKFYASREIEILAGHRVSSVDPGSRSVVLADNKKIAYDKLLLATGGVPRKLKGARVGQENFFYLRSFSDGRKIADAAARSKSVLILGASFIGMEVAASLCQRGLEVHVAAPEKVPLQGILGERIGGFLRRIHEEKGVHFHLGTTVGSLEGEPVVEEAVLSDGSRIAVNMVIAGLGIDPVVDYLKEAGLVSDGGVPVDSQLKTQGEGIFAAGDIAIVPHWKTGEGIRVEHWIVAESQGRHAARSMMGKGSPYRDVPVFWTKQYDGSLKYAGYAREVDRIAYRGSVEEGNFTAGFYEDDALKAVATLGRIREVIYLSELLRNGENIPFDQFEGFQLK